MEEEEPVVGQRERGKRKASSGADLERPARQNPLQLVVDVRMLQKEPGWVCLEHRFDDSVLLTCVLRLARGVVSLYNSLRSRCLATRTVR
jgi:hypothetical protein